MTQFIFELIFQYGAIPGAVLYFVHSIVKMHRGELKEIKEKLEEHQEKQQNEINHQNKSINELVLIMQTMHNTMANQMNVLILKFIELSQKNGGDK